MEYVRADHVGSVSNRGATLVWSRNVKKGSDAFCSPECFASLANSKEKPTSGSIQTSVAILLVE
jgi:hypothetical protein